ncbi:MAG: DUF4258 domain-containing protein [Flavobacteriaceae bacterium]|nr:DUF4258 domain-containing protein [Flavobacteriaceae bacterium]
MGLLKRFGYFFIGLSLGIVAVTFFWKQKKVSFDYGMDARTLKTIRIKQKIYSTEAQRTLSAYNLDTIAINYILKNGDVNFSKSKQREKPCAKYMIEGDYKGRSIDLWIVRCDSTATIEKVFIK